MKKLITLLFSLTLFACNQTCEECDKECVKKHQTLEDQRKCFYAECNNCIDITLTPDAGSDAGFDCWMTCPCEYLEDPTERCVVCKARNCE